MHHHALRVRLGMSLAIVIAAVLLAAAPPELLLLLLLPQAASSRAPMTTARAKPRRTRSAS